MTSLHDNLTCFFLFGSFLSQLETWEMADDEPWAETLPHYHKIEMVTSSRYRSCCNSKTCSQKSTQISAYIIGKSTSHTRPLPTDHSLDRGLDIALQSNIKCKRVKGDILPDTIPLTAINDKLVITAKISPKKIPPSSLQQNGTIISKPYVKRLQIQLLR